MFCKDNDAELHHSTVIGNMSVPTPSNLIEPHSDALDCPEIQFIVQSTLMAVLSKFAV